VMGEGSSEIQRPEFQHCTRTFFAMTEPIGAGCHLSKRAARSSVQATCMPAGNDNQKVRFTAWSPSAASHMPTPFHYSLGRCHQLTLGGAENPRRRALCRASAERKTLRSTVEFTHVPPAASSPPNFRRCCSVATRRAASERRRARQRLIRDRRQTPHPVHDFRAYMPPPARTAVSA